VVIEPDKKGSLEGGGETVTSVLQEGDSCPTEHGANLIGTGPMIVVSQDGEEAKRGAQPAEWLQQPWRVAGPERHEIAAEQDQVGGSLLEGSAGGLDQLDRRGGAGVKV
jgi:hypothetical protein